MLLQVAGLQQEVPRVQAGRLLGAGGSSCPVTNIIDRFNTPGSGGRVPGAAVQRVFFNGCLWGGCGGYWGVSNGYDFIVLWRGGGRGGERFALGNFD